MKKETKRNLAFAVGDIFGGGSFNIINFLYPAYIALQVGIPLALSGVIMFIARIWDAVIDPVLGQISDRTKPGKFGKRRIYILIGAPLVILTLLLTFFPWGFQSVGLKFAAVLISYMLFCTTQSLIMIPYYSLASEITSDYEKRTKANTLRLGFSIFSSIVCVAVPGMLVTPGDGASYIRMTLIFGICFAIPLIITALFAKEDVASPKVETKLKFNDFVQPLKLKPFRQYLGMHIATSFTMAVLSGLFFFYINYWVKASEFAQSGSAPFIGMIAAGLMFATQIAALPFYLNRIKKSTKAAAYRLGSAIWIVAAIALFFIPKDLPQIWLLLTFAVVMGFGICGPGLVPHTMLGDVVNVGSVKFKQPLEGAFSGLQNFISQLSQALGMLVVMAAIGWAGFQESYYENGQQIVPLFQSDSAMLALRLFMSLTPLIIMGVGILISTRYRITRQAQEKAQQLYELILTQTPSEELDKDCADFLQTM